MKKRYSLNHILNAKKIKFKVPFSWYSVISTWFYIGKLPAPGTCGSIAVYPLYYFIAMILLFHGLIFNMWRAFFEGK